MITLQERVHGTPPPSTWALGKLHRVLRVRKNFKNLGMKEDNLLSLSYGRIIRRDIETAAGLLPESFETYQIVEPGNIVMRLTDLQNDKRSLRQALVRERGIITSAYDALELGPEHDPRFWAYALLALDLAKYYYSLGGGVRQSINFADFPNDWIAVPGGRVQKSIADFLDRETARIDLLIEKKKRMCAVAAERLQAQISLRATRGFCGSPDLVQSNVPYLGLVPKHWHIVKLGSRYSVQLGKMLDAARIHGNDLRPYLRVADVQWGEIRVTDLPQMDFSVSDRRKFRLERGDLLVNEGGSYVGRSAIWAAPIEECYYQKALHRLRPYRPDRDTARFLYYLMTFATKQGVFVAGGNQTTIDHLTAEALRRYRFAFPPFSEQQKIADELATLEEKTLKVVNAIEESIKSLGDYRDSLITAAVTGKIDTSSQQKDTSKGCDLEAIEAELPT
jgi:type I restriction enzyme S subunit